MKQKFLPILSCILLFFACSLNAQMRITEYMYTGEGEEFIEFTNIGNTTIDMTGWSYDDSSQTPGVFSLSGFGMVAPGESVIITEDNSADFRLDWGLDASVKVLGGYNNNLGRNDEINLFDDNDVLIDQLTYGDEDFVGTIRTNGQSGWAFTNDLGNNSIASWMLSTIGDVEQSFESSSGDVGSPGSYSFPMIAATADQLAIWTFDNLDDICSGTSLLATTEDARGVPILQQFFQEIDDNGKSGFAYTDVLGVVHPAGKAIAWDDIKGDGDDAELWITISTLDWSNLSIRFDYQIDDDGSNDSYDLEYSIDGGFTWSKPVNNASLTDDNSFNQEFIDLSAQNALDNQPCVIFRFSDFDNDGNNEFRFDNIEITGVKSVPDVNAPIVEVHQSGTTNFLDLDVAGCGFVSAVVNDPTDPAASLGIEFRLSDSDTLLNGLVLSANSSDQSVVPNANLIITGNGENRNLKINPIGAGYTDIEVVVSDGVFSDTYLIKYAASAQLPPTAICHTGVSDASTAIAINDYYMLVADDENEVIRLYDRNHSGLPINSFDFTKDLDLEGQPREVDIEASVQVGNRIYWLGSHSNSSEGEERPNRSRMFATDLSGAGANVDLSFVGFYEHLKIDLVSWDAGNGHGLGANFFGLAASTANGELPEAADGFNIEGLAMAPSSTTTAYVAFRAPIAPATNRTKALIVPVENFTSLLGASQGTAVFGTPIQLDLGGRGIRSLASNDNDEYLIVAGPAGSAGAAPNDFQLYFWDGNDASAPVMIDANPALGINISFESIVSLPTPLNNGDIIQMLADNGDTDWYADGMGSKDLPPSNFQKFCSGNFSLDLCAVDNTPPIALCNDLSIQLDANGMAGITAEEVDNNSTDDCGIASLGLSTETFTCEDLGTQYVTLIVTDEKGNTASCEAEISVTDVIAPQAVCLNSTVEIQPDGQYTLMESDVFDMINSSDNCAITAVDFPATTYTCEEVGMSFVVPATISDQSGNTDDCTANILVEIGEALPAGWSTADIGVVTIGNDYSFDPCTAPNPEDGEFTITGSGNNAIGATSDNIAFASQLVCGDGTITAKVERITPNGYGGLMIREDTSPGSKQVGIFSNLTNILRHETRYTANGTKQVNSFYKPASIWLRLIRQGDWIFAYYSSNGVNFQYVHGVFVPMQSCVEIGLASFTYQPNQQTEAVFSMVEVTGSNTTSLADPSPAATVPFFKAATQREIMLYPNPASNQFTVELDQPLLENAEAVLIDQWGRVLETQTMAEGVSELAWKTDHLPTGVYILQLQRKKRQIGVPKRLIISR